jgi:hypothetical protein
MLGEYQSLNATLAASFDEVKRMVTKNIRGMLIGSYSLSS